MSAQDYGAFAYPVDGNLRPIGDSVDPFTQARADSCDTRVLTAEQFIAEWFRRDTNV